MLPALALACARLKVGSVPAEADHVMARAFEGSQAPGTTPGQALFCVVGDRLLAVPLNAVVEIMRPLPIQAFHGTPRFVLGVATIRAAVLPVIDVGELLGVDREPGSSPGRFVTIVQDGRRAALAVDTVLGVQLLDTAGLQDLPPLLDSIDLETVSRIGTLDVGLLLVLDHTHLVPDSVWAPRNEQVTTS
jgi:purine-binding chemotaxis protein CheW